MTDDGFEADVDARLHDLRVQREAKRRDTAELWTPPPYPLSLYEQLEEAEPDDDYIFNGLWSGNLQLNAQKKAGKTTLMLNAVRSLVTREPFLGRFEAVVEPDCRVGFLNMELKQHQFNKWFRAMDLPEEAQKRIVPYHGRVHGALDFSNDRVVEWIIRWCRDEGIKIAFFDPLNAIYNATRWGGNDPNDAYLRWWAVFEHIVLQANLRGTWIGHHAGYSEDGGNRARGASAMMDKPDLNVTLRYEVGEGSYTDAPVDTKRYISAFGRDVDVAEFEVDYNPATRLYHVTGGGSRTASAVNRHALKAYDAMVSYTNIQRQKGVKDEVIELKAGDLADQARVSATSKESEKFRRGRTLAVREGWLRERKQGTSQYYSLGDKKPPEREKRKVGNNIINPS